MFIISYHIAGIRYHVNTRNIIGFICLATACVAITISTTLNNSNYY